MQYNYYTIKEEIDFGLEMRCLPPLDKILDDEHSISSYVHMYYLIRHVFAEPIFVWYKLLFGFKINIKMQGDSLLKKKN